MWCIRNFTTHGGRIYLLKLIVTCFVIYLVSVSITDTYTSSDSDIVINEESDNIIQEDNVIVKSDKSSPELMEELRDDDPKLISIIKSKIVPPASDSYQNLENENIKSGQVLVI